MLISGIMTGKNLTGKARISKRKYIIQVCVSEEHITSMCHPATIKTTNLAVSKEEIMMRLSPPVVKCIEVGRLTQQG